MKAATETGLSDADRLAIVDAIGDAEHGSLGEVRVHIEERCPGDDAMARAKELFARLGMSGTKRATGVLLYVATKDRRVAVFADRGLFGATAPAVWSGVVERVAAGYRAGRPAAGIVEALTMVGDVLRGYAAGADVHGDELPNEVSES